MSTVFDRTASAQSLTAQARPQTGTGRGARQAVVTAVAVALLVAGCAGMDDTQRRTAAGAGIGKAGRPGVEFSAGDGAPRAQFPRAEVHFGQARVRLRRGQIGPQRAQGLGQVAAARQGRDVQRRRPGRQRGGQMGGGGARGGGVVGHVAGAVAQAGRGLHGGMPGQPQGGLCPAHDSPADQVASQKGGEAASAR